MAKLDVSNFLISQRSSNCVVAGLTYPPPMLLASMFEYFDMYSPWKKTNNFSAPSLPSQCAFAPRGREVVVGSKRLARARAK